MAGMPASTLFDEMKSQDIPRKSWRKALRPNAPYGYAWLSGELVVNPIEYKTVKLMLDLSSIQMRPYHIANYLNERGIKPTSGKKWFARTVTDTLDREKSKTNKV